ncbi:MAG: 3-deoxy-manno-octulosonate cytidylyltransferase [Synergistaceae bacterium]|nr:3-deoxy-manno-octulosonate cytidylyltransferase [Synergistota bacterium]NLM71098.1 3-deoxy-manno-octulosonate cytidylyltransferase [Synergistaceae bacterium]
MRILGVIPARYASTRLPAKPLADVCGKTLVQRVYERASESGVLDRLVVATDDERIMEAVRGFGGEAVLTSPDHPDGTSRVAEAVRPFDCDIVLNIQGDEPLLDPVMVEEAANLLVEDETALSATLCSPLSNQALLDDPSAVKVVRDLRGFALYFSRSLIPFVRVSEGAPPVYEHIGIYSFRRDFLYRFVSLPPTPLSRAESLEQLKILEHGYNMKVGVTCGAKLGPSVDTPEDLEEVRRIIRGAGFNTP